MPRMLLNLVAAVGNWVFSRRLWRIRCYFCLSAPPPSCQFCLIARFPLSLSFPVPCRALCYLSLNMGNKALKDADEALKLDPNCGVAHVRCATPHNTIPYILHVHIQLSIPAPAHARPYPIAHPIPRYRGGIIQGRISASQILCEIFVRKLFDAFKHGYTSRCAFGHLYHARGFR